MIDISQERDRQRFIDGELSIDDENDAIIQCEINPDLWRGLALSMVEQRRLAVALSSADKSNQATVSLPSTSNATSNASGSRVGAERSPRISWRTAASIAAVIGFSVFAFAAGRKEGLVSSLANQKLVQESGQESGPVFVQVQYPENRPVTDPSLASMSHSLFNSEAQAIFAEAGYRVDETLQWQIVNEGDAYVAVPNREVRFVSVQP